MARALEDKNCRLVIIGGSEAPGAMSVEYRVVNSGLTEAPKRIVFEGTDFDDTINDLWQSAVGAATAAEELA